MECKGYIRVLKRTGENGSRCPVMGQCVIGSALSCDMRITLKGVESEHCKIFVDGHDQAIIENLASQYPTLLNGSSLKLRQRRVLGHGDEFTVSERKFRWEYLPSSYFFVEKSSHLTPLNNINSENKRVSVPLTSVHHTPGSSHRIAVVTPVRRESALQVESKIEKLKKSIPVNKFYRHSLQGLDLLKKRTTSRKSCVPRLVASKHVSAMGKELQVQSPAIETKSQLSVHRKSKSFDDRNSIVENLGDSVNIIKKSSRKSVRSSIPTKGRKSVLKKSPAQSLQKSKTPSRKSIRANLQSSNEILENADVQSSLPLALETPSKRKSRKSVNYSTQEHSVKKTSDDFSSMEPESTDNKLLQSTPKIDVVESSEKKKSDFKSQLKTPKRRVLETPDAIQKSAKRLKLTPNVTSKKKLNPPSNSGNSTASKKVRKPLFSEMLKKNVSGLQKRSVVVQNARRPVQRKVVRPKVQLIRCVPAEVKFNSTGHADSPETIIIRKKIKTPHTVSRRKSLKMSILKGTPKRQTSSKKTPARKSVSKQVTLQTSNRKSIGRRTPLSKTPLSMSGRHLKRVGMSSLEVTPELNSKRRTSQRASLGESGFSTPFGENKESARKQTPKKEKFVSEGKPSNSMGILSSDVKWTPLAVKTPSKRKGDSLKVEVTPLKVVTPSKGKLVSLTVNSLTKGTRISPRLSFPPKSKGTPISMKSPLNQKCSPLKVNSPSKEKDTLAKTTPLNIGSSSKDKSSPQKMSSPPKGKRTPAKINSPLKNKKTPLRVNSPPKDKSTSQKISSPQKEKQTPTRERLSFKTKTPLKVSSPSKDKSSPQKMSSPPKGKLTPAKVSSPLKSKKTPSRVNSPPKDKSTSASKKRPTPQRIKSEGKGKLTPERINSVGRDKKTPANVHSPYKEKKTPSRRSSPLKLEQRSTKENALSKENKTPVKIKPLPVESQTPIKILQEKQTAARVSFSPKGKLPSTRVSSTSKAEQSPARVRSPQTGKDSPRRARSEMQEKLPHLELHSASNNTETDMRKSTPLNRKPSPVKANLSSKNQLALEVKDVDDMRTPHQEVASSGKGYSHSRTSKGLLYSLEESSSLILSSDGKSSVKDLSRSAKHMPNKKNKETDLLLRQSCSSKGGRNSYVKAHSPFVQGSETIDRSLLKRRFSEEVQDSVLSSRKKRKIRTSDIDSPDVFSPFNSSLSSFKTPRVPQEVFVSPLSSQKSSSGRKFASIHPTTLTNDNDLKGVTKPKSKKTPRKSTDNLFGVNNSSPVLLTDLAGEDNSEMQVPFENLSALRNVKSPRMSVRNRCSERLQETPEFSKAQKAKDIKFVVKSPGRHSTPRNKSKNVPDESEAYPKNIMLETSVKKKLHLSPKNDSGNIHVEKILRTPKIPVSPRNDLTDVKSVKKLLGTPKAPASPKNDLTDTKGVKKSLRTPKVQKSPKNVLSNIKGVKKVFSSPEIQPSPKNDLTDVRGVKKLLGSPKVQKSPRNDLSDVRGVKKLLGTPPIQKSPRNDLRDVRGVKRLLGTPKVQKSPRNDLTDVRGVKKILGTPPIQKSPRNDLRDLRGVKRLLGTPKVQNSPRNDLRDVRGIKRLLGTPKVQKSPRNDLTDVRGVRKLLGTPRVQNSPRNDLTDVKGVKKLLRTPRAQKSPKNDLTDVSGLQVLFEIYEGETQNNQSLQSDSENLPSAKRTRRMRVNVSPIERITRNLRNASNKELSPALHSKSQKKTGFSPSVSKSPQNNKRRKLPENEDLVQKGKENIEISEGVAVTPNQEVKKRSTRAKKQNIIEVSQTDDTDVSPPKIRRTRNKTEEQNTPKKKSEKVVQPQSDSILSTEQETSPSKKTPIRTRRGRTLGSATVATKQLGGSAKKAEVSSSVFNTVEEEKSSASKKPSSKRNLKTKQSSPIASPAIFDTVEVAKSPLSKISPPKTRRGRIKSSAIESPMASPFPQTVKSERSSISEQTPPKTRRGRSRTVAVEISAPVLQSKNLSAISPVSGRTALKSGKAKDSPKSPVKGKQRRGKVTNSSPDVEHNLQKVPSPEVKSALSSPHKKQTRSRKNEKSVKFEDNVFSEERTRNKEVEKNIEDVSVIKTQELKAAPRVTRSRKPADIEGRKTSPQATRTLRRKKT